MKKMMLLLSALLFALAPQIRAQSNVTVDEGASLTVDAGADACADSKTADGTIGGDGTWCEDSPIPVKLSSFSAVVENRQVTLNWVTESAVNHAGFILERSADNGPWAEIASLKSDPALCVNNTGHAEYSYTDLAVAAGGSYGYRLSDVSLDGRITSHPAVSVQLEKLPECLALHAAYPNPFNPTTTIAFDLPEDGAVTLTVFDMKGRQIGVLLRETLAAGRHQQAWDARNFSSGVYFMQMQTEGFTAMQRVLLLK